MTEIKFNILLEITKTLEKYMERIYDIEPQMIKYNDPGGRDSSKVLVTPGEEIRRHAALAAVLSYKSMLESLA